MIEIEIVQLMTRRVEGLLGEFGERFTCSSVGDCCCAVSQGPTCISHRPSPPGSNNNNNTGRMAAATLKNDEEGSKGRVLYTEVDTYNPRSHRADYYHAAAVEGGGLVLAADAWHGPVWQAVLAPKALYSRVMHAMASTFLPVGYPHVRARKRLCWGGCAHRALGGIDKPHIQPPTHHRACGRSTSPTKGGTPCRRSAATCAGS